MAAESRQVGSGQAARTTGASVRALLLVIAASLVALLTAPASAHARESLAVTFDLRESSASE